MRANIQNTNAMMIVPLLFLGMKFISRVGSDEFDAHIINKCFASFIIPEIKFQTVGTFNKVWS